MSRLDWFLRHGAGKRARRLEETDVGLGKIRPLAEAGGGPWWAQRGRWRERPGGPGGRRPVSDRARPSRPSRPSRPGVP